MTFEVDLTGYKVLVIEDEYHLAQDIERALKEAGAVVLGPVGQERQALALVASEDATCALVDIDLGQGAQFNVADALRYRRVPFVFVTGYDDVMIPSRFDKVERIRKPTDLQQVVRTVARLRVYQW